MITSPCLTPTWGFQLPIPALTSLQAWVFSGARGTGAWEGEVQRGTEGMQNFPCRTLGSEPLISSETSVCWWGN